MQYKDSIMANDFTGVLARLGIEQPQGKGLLSAMAGMPRPEGKPSAPANRNTSVLKYSKDPLIQSIIIQESGGNPKAVSPVGAEGLMQIMPNTASKPGYQIKPLKDAFDPVENVRFGTDYFNAMLEKFENPRDALIAYNWGPGNTNKWLKNGGDVSKLPGETREYFQKVLGRLNNGR
jgi:soluble lytic murein transglycosylase-like protein